MRFTFQVVAIDRLGASKFFYEKFKMTSFQIGNISVGGAEDPCFIVAEIGQNHQGNIEIAKQLILEAKRAGCHCVKFQKSCLTAKFTKAALARSYKTDNSWGSTYGDHKEYLEFSISQYKELKSFASNVGILFSASAMDEVSFGELQNLGLPFIKIGSGDANNFKLIEHAAKQPIPLIISTGMQEMSTVERIVGMMRRHKKSNFCLLHCVSSYPTLPQNANLRLITYLKRRFPKIPIGYSGHEQGIAITLAAVLLGAKVIERHFTLDKKQKGSDHSSSLTPTELALLIRAVRELQFYFKICDIPKTKEVIEALQRYYSPDLADLKSVELALREVNLKTILECEMSCRRKLGKSLVYTKNFLAGHTITKDDLAVKVSEPCGVTAECIEVYVGKILKKDVEFDDPLQDSDFV